MKMIDVHIISEIEAGDKKALRAGIWKSESGRVHAEISLGLSENISPMPHDPHICLPIDDIPKLIELLAVLMSHQRDHNGNNNYPDPTFLS